MSHRLRSGWAAPTAATEPRDAIAWVRRMEIATGVAGIAFGLALWNAGWWHWLLIGFGVFGVLPIWGAAAILRRADRKPDTLVSDPDRRRARARRALWITVPAYTALGAVIGYVVGGAGVAVFVAIMMALAGGAGAWLTTRRFR